MEADGPRLRCARLRATGALHVAHALSGCAGRVLVRRRLRSRCRKAPARQGLGMPRHDDGGPDSPKALRMMPESPATKAAAMTIVSMYGFLLRVAAAVKSTARTRHAFTRTAHARSYTPSAACSPILISAVPLASTAGSIFALAGFGRNGGARQAQRQPQLGWSLRLPELGR
jgi:hypothetical protein